MFPWISGLTYINTLVCVSSIVYDMRMKMKECSHCKSQMRKDADTCPACGKSQPNMALLILAIFFVSPLLCCIGFIIISLL